MSMTNLLDFGVQGLAVLCQQLQCSLTAAEPPHAITKVCAYELDRVCIELTTVQGLRIALPAVLNVGGGTPLLCEAWGQHLLPRKAMLPCAPPNALMQINIRAATNSGYDGLGCQHFSFFI